MNMNMLKPSEGEAKAPAAASTEIKDLLSLIDKRSLECLNQESKHPISHAVDEPLRLDDAVYLESDCDAQLLINVSFNQSVKVHSISLKALNPESAPKSLKIFSNPINIGFDDAEQHQGTQVLDLTPEQVAEGAVIPLKFVKFQAVNSLAIFIGENHGGSDKTIIHSLRFFGCPRDQCNMKDWDKIKKTAD